MNQNCQNCKKDFLIDEGDQNYYKKIDVPHPTWCPECRMIRRINNINSWALFWRNCDNCGKHTLSMYPPTQEITVYCQPCWWSDEWDGTEYGQEYDPARPFLSQVREVMQKTPYMALDTEYLTLQHCEYSNSLGYSKNCLLAIWADYCENVYHSSILNKLKDSAECLRMQDSQLCYESSGQNKGYRIFYSEECDSCTDVWFSRNCYSCTNCIGCVNLRGASYQIFNVQYTKDEYAGKIAEMRLDTRSGIFQVQKQAHDLWKKLPYRAYSGNSFNLNTTGEYVYGAKNSKEMYIANGTEDCTRCQFITVKPARDCMDYSGWGNNSDLMYESASCGVNCSNCKFCATSFVDLLNVEYAYWVVGGKNNFGCVNLKRKHHAILNKTYEKEEYEKLREQIIADMKSNPYQDNLGRSYPYGEFFPPEFSNFAYNTSNAYKFFPKKKEEALAEGYRWHEEAEQSLEATLSAENLPETIAEVSDSILKEIIACSFCSKKYRIAALEFDILRKLNLPLPRECPKCRDNRHFANINKPGLHERTCEKCDTAVTSSFSPERQEIVYCETCYQQEFV